MTVFAAFSFSKKKNITSFRRKEDEQNRHMMKRMDYDIYVYTYLFVSFNTRVWVTFEHNYFEAEPSR